MPVIINTNTSASLAQSNLGVANATLHQSLLRLSSGSMVGNSSNNPSGVGISMRPAAEIGALDATNGNIANAVSFLQTQDGALTTANQMVDRMGALLTSYNDPTRTAADKANYNVEFKDLQQQLGSLQNATFNGINLFTSAASSLSVNTSVDGTQSTSLSRPDLTAGPLSTLIDSHTTLGSLSVSNVSDSITALAEAQSQNGAQANQLGFASSLVATTQNNLQATNSRITDVDVAQQSTVMATSNILVQASTAMLSQANSSTQIAMKLLQS